MSDFYLNNIINSEDNIARAIIKIIKARGFLIDAFDGEYYLSDNAAVEDTVYLFRGLKKYNLGRFNFHGKAIEVKNRRNWERDNGYRTKSYKSICPKSIEIIISKQATIESAISFFKKTGQVGLEGGVSIRGWLQYITEELGPKWPVQYTEPYICLYSKAISACGVYTSYSCDGNHKKGGQIFVFSDYPSNIWHECIWKYIVLPHYGKMPFIGRSRGEMKGIPFTKENQEEIYLMIHSIATYLYENREAIRVLKRLTVDRIDKRFLHQHTRDEIEEYYHEECVRTLAGIDILKM